MTKPFVVFLNGPPGSGKDFAAKVLQEADDITVSHYKFADPMKDMACALLEINRKELEHSKSLTMDIYGVSLKQILIDMSEKFMKPCYGKDIFGRICAERMAEEIQLNDVQKEDQPDLFIISDSGFATEAKQVLRLFGDENALLIRLHREGCTYEEDSRSYIELDTVRTVDVANMGDESFAKSLLRVVRDWMKERKNDAQS